MTEQPASQRIKVICAMLDETDTHPVLVGVIDPDSLGALKSDSYQREEFSPKKREGMAAALRDSESGGLPPIELGMRGTKVTTDPDGAPNVFYLDDAPVYIIDGLQRRAAARQVKEEGGAPPRLRAVIYVGTTREWELVRFGVINLTQARLSPNITLRNMSGFNRAANVLYRLATEEQEDFPLYKKIVWTQNRQNGLLTARNYFKTVGSLHRHAGPGLANGAVGLAQGLEKIHDVVGAQTFSDNVKLFFDIVDTCFGIRKVHYVESASQLRLTFLTVLSQILADYAMFWQGHKLVVKPAFIDRLKDFPLGDPTVIQLAASGGKSYAILYRMMKDWLNGDTENPRRTNELGLRRFDERLSSSAKVETLSKEHA